MAQKKTERSERERGRSKAVTGIGAQGGDGRGEQVQQSGNPIARAARSVGRALRRTKNRLTHQDVVETPVATQKERTPAKAARLTRRETDIPMDELARTYTPTQTSLKASFRIDGRDQQRDQEYANGVSDNHWNDEDRYTNRSGDPRIGTHGRSYEAAEMHRGSDEE